MCPGRIWRAWTWWLAWLALLAGQAWAGVYLGMSKEELMREMGRPTSVLSRPGREIMIFANGARITLENDRVTGVDGMEFAGGKPGEAAQSAGSEVGADVQPDAVNPDNLAQPLVVFQPKEVVTPDFPAEGQPVPPELRPTAGELAAVEAEAQAREAARAEEGGEEMMEEDWAEEDFELEGAESSPVKNTILFWVVQLVVSLIVVKMAVQVTGVTAFWGGILAIAGIEVAVRSLLQAILGGLEMEFFADGAGTVVSFFVMLYTVRAFTSAREWPTIIKVVVMTKVVSAVLAWAMTLVWLNT